MGGPAGVTGFGMNAQVDLAGAPTQLKVNVSPGPLDAKAMSDIGTLCPAVTCGAAEFTTIAAVPTVWLTAVEALATKVASPLYCAVTECVPAVRVEIEIAALPPLSVAGAPICDVPSKNVTVPVGVPTAVLVTAAVNITDWVTTEGLIDEARVVALGLSTTWVRTLEVLVAKLASPP